MQPPNYTSLLHHAKSICFKVSSSLPLLPALQLNEHGLILRGEIFAKKRRELAEGTPLPHAGLENRLSTTSTSNFEKFVRWYHEEKDLHVEVDYRL